MHSNQAAKEETAFNPDDIRAQRTEVGRDTLITVTGGAAHIGAVSTAYWTESGIEVRTTTVPGHKEHLLSEPAARRAADMLNRTVTVVMGIHYDAISAEEIAETSSVAMRRLEEALSDRSNAERQAEKII
ncbi:hypothetical protein QWJ34_20535 [Saccharibacillus sp. CPCC 101409]|uniref:prenylated flavin chaperone LpdD n=1 Tax=Saccharibacillus sp. CPCC 101409 TaxID=3058041 RepID=UPI002670E3BF|nr:hypothetical protein [Saccharibacillus sp. CPCC 101409]MDO3412162.1 hypothetical protein [Saccharibacillus sp. CPCC 101409]